MRAKNKPSNAIFTSIPFEGDLVATGAPSESGCMSGTITLIEHDFRYAANAIQKYLIHTNGPVMLVGSDGYSVSIRDHTLNMAITRLERWVNNGSMWIIHGPPGGDDVALSRQDNTLCWPTKLDQIDRMIAMWIRRHAWTIFPWGGPSGHPVLGLVERSGSGRGERLVAKFDQAYRRTLSGPHVPVITKHIGARQLFSDVATAMLIHEPEPGDAVWKSMKCEREHPWVVFGPPETLVFHVDYESVGNIRTTDPQRQILWRSAGPISADNPTGPWLYRVMEQEVFKLLALAGMKGNMMITMDGRVSQNDAKNYSLSLLQNQKSLLSTIRGYISRSGHWASISGIGMMDAAYTLVLGKNPCVLKNTKIDASPGVACVALL